MYAYPIDPAFGLDHIVRQPRADPTPGDSEVVVAMRASSINFRDYLTIIGKYNPRQSLPLVPCSDGAGVVKAVGSEVTRFRPGDRVMPCFAQGWIEGPITNAFRHITLGGPLDGTLSEFMLLPEGGLVGVPEYLDDLEASTLPCAALTAWNAVVNQGRAGEGTSVVIQGTGGVAIFALQFAVMVGAKPIVISKSDAKLGRARELGAEATVNYTRDSEWSRIVKELTDGVGADLIIELGGQTTLEQSVRAVRSGGQIAMIGVLGGPTAQLNLPLVVMRNVRLQGVTVGSRRDFENMLLDMEAVEIRPVIDRVFDIEDVREAFKYLEAGRHFGKICISHDRAGPQADT